ncbi:MAG: cobalamin biosynthesis protein CobD [Clostridiales bacterium]|uniref:adenosylcobinamide-phosphate synthase CbiB n=1 Tax=Clostridium sp. N3C TaxID=1776758 RepID=UPI00092DF8D7|nr:adenosylcobinamide-phosphate synthase CbiB [Clostridium sp. N3C]NLZ50021.1 cobalamin biosynthesis protein CobD [Clostridiales bacterium]SCN26219.1 cobalamin biosynthesis protein [Clostridium sp. N3C]
MLLNIVAAVLLDFILGDPYSFPHIVKLMGKIITLEEKLARKLSKSNLALKISGLIIVIINISLGFLSPFFLLRFLKQYKILYNIVDIYFIYSCIAARSLHYEAIKVYKALDIGIEEARKRLSNIVGRDTEKLSENGVIRATVETVAENTSDGVIAPLFYIMLFGLPGGIAYKFINTMDSMLGYMTKEYIDIGYFPAKVDGLVNYIPARITGLLMNISAVFRFNIKNGFKIMIRDRKNHKSPNAIYPEAAVAGLLGIRLGGNNYYHGELVKKPTIGDKLNEINKKHIKNTIEIMYRSEIFLLTIYFAYIFFIKLV